MKAADLLRQNDLDGASKALLEEVRADPANPKLRVFLFQLFCVGGQWDRAKTQLDTVVGLDKGALLMARIYGDAIACEAARRSVFAGEAGATIFGEPQPWMAELQEALRLDARGERKAAAELRAKAFDKAPASAGRIDGQDFAWIADADPRTGPMLEVVVNGRYFWLPFLRVSAIKLEEPTDLRDQVWMSAQITLSNGGEVGALIPTRYAGSEADADPLVRLARKTEWIETAPDSFEGRGQRLLATDAGEFPLMDARLIEIAEPAEAGPAHG